MARFNLLSFIFLLMFVFGFLFSADFNFTGNAISEGFSQLSFLSIFTIFSFVMFLFVFASSNGLEAIFVPTGNEELGWHIERARKGIEYYNGLETQPKVLISGSVDGQYGRDFLKSQPGHIYKFMREKGIPREAFMFEPTSKNTAENVLYSAKLINENEIKELDVISNPSHLWRFKLLFEKAKEEGVIDEDVEINFVPTKKNFLFESFNQAFYGVAAYVKDFIKYKTKSLKDLSREE